MPTYLTCIEESHRVDMSIGGSGHVKPNIKREAHASILSQTGRIRDIATMIISNIQTKKKIGFYCVAMVMCISSCDCSTKELGDTYN